MDFIYLVLVGMACMAGAFTLTFSIALLLIVLNLFTKPERFDPVFLKAITKDYGVFASYSQRRVTIKEKITYQAYIVERDGKRFFAIREYSKGLIGYSVTFILFDPNTLLILKARLEEALATLNKPYLTRIPDVNITDRVAMGNAIALWKDIFMADNVQGFLGATVPSEISLAVLSKFPSLLAQNRSRNGDRIQVSPHVVIKRSMSQGPLFSIDYFHLDSVGIRSLLEILDDALGQMPHNGSFEYGPDPGP